MRVTSLAVLLLFSIVQADNCPSGYSQAPKGGYCYKIKNFYDTFVGVYYPKSFDDVANECKSDGGGFLASVHNDEENEFIYKLADATPRCGDNHNELWTNMGMKCVGKTCKWADGSPLTFTKFAEAPSDDGQTRCYGFYNIDRSWSSKNCAQKYQSDCWACSVKAKPGQCNTDETPYNGGCVSVHTSPLDQKSAKASCPGGGNLVSIHSYDENAFYTQLALAAGVTGTIYIGGEFSNGKFEWVDGSTDNSNNWANGFPNTIFGECSQMLLASEFGIQGQWTNIDCAVEQPYLCFRDIYGPTVTPPPPKIDAVCPPIQYFTGSGSVFSPNYPVSIPNNQNCEYVLGAEEGTRAKVKFPVFNCTSGTSLALFDGLNSDLPFITYTTKSPSPDQWYTATSNVLKIVFSANATTAPVGTGWQAEFTGV